MIKIYAELTAVLMVFILFKSHTSVRIRFNLFSGGVGRFCVCVCFSFSFSVFLFLFLFPPLRFARTEVAEWLESNVLCQCAMPGE